MNPWHKNMSRISTCRYIGDYMLKAFTFQSSIAAPAISLNVRSWFYVIHNKSVEAFRGYVWYNRKPYPTWTAAPNLGGDCNYSFSFCSTPSNFGSCTTNISFINFNGANQAVTAGAYHRTTQFMQPIPRCIVTAKTENSFQAKSTGPMLLTCHKPNCEKPHTKWFVSFMKQCSRGNGCLSFAFSAQEKAPFHHRGIFCNGTACRANKSLGPSKFYNVGKTSIFRDKPFIKFLESAGIINATNRVRRLFHGHILHVVAG